MSTDIFTTDFVSQPYWSQGEAASSGDLASAEPISLPAEVDVLIVGSGYTGLHAALQTAREGLGTLVLDSAAIGGGCSGRNGGQVSTRIKGSFTQLAGKYGGRLATSLLREGPLAVEFLDQFIRAERLECHWERCGHFSGAHNTAAYETIARELAALPSEVGIDWHMVNKNEQSAEIGSERYQGGVVFPEHRSLDPVLYHSGLLARVQAAGAEMVGHCAVERIELAGDGFDVHTAAGVIRAGKVAVATNGYTGPSTPWLQRRIIPIGSYIIATEPLDSDLAKSLSPKNRTITDTRKLVLYYRLSPDRRRMLFGGRVAVAETDPRASAQALRAAMCEIYPQLATVKVSHSWLGFVGYTFDSLPHVGEHDGLHYAMGYCGSGIALASYCGSIMGSRMCGHTRSSAFMNVDFKTLPLYAGRPWFLKPSIQYYRLRDRLNF